MASDWKQFCRLFFLNLFFLIFQVFLIDFAFLQVIHCHYQSQASSMPSKEEWFTHDTTVFLHLNNHIQNQRKEMQERTQGNDGHLQHTMASLVIILNLLFNFFFLFFFLMCHTDLS